jgi:MFS family permease
MTSTEPPAPGAGARYGQLAMMFMAHGIGTANITLVLAMAPAVQAGLGLDHAGFGLTIAAYYAAMVVWSLPAGWLADRLGIRWTLAIAFLLMACGMTAVSRAPGMALAAFGLAVCGFGYAMVNPATARGVFDAFPHRGRATAMGIKQTGVPTGGILAALATAATGGAPWREMALACAALSLASAVAFLFLRAGRAAESRRAGFGDMARIARQPRLLALNGSTGVFSCVQAALFGYFVLFAHDALALDAARAGICLAVVHGFAAAGRIGWGIAGDLLPGAGREAALIICAVLGAAGLVLLAVAPGVGYSALLALSALLGLTIAGNASLGQTATAEAVEPRFAGAAMGGNMLMVTIGSMVAPALFGRLVEQVGYAPAWILFAGLALVAGGLVALSLLRRGGPAAVPASTSSV